MVSTTSQPALDTVPLTKLKGVGAAVAEKLASLGIHNVQDVLFHLPYRYQDRTQLAKIGSLRPGSEAVVSVEVVLADVVFRKRRSLMVRVSDGTGSLMLRFFHFTQQQVKQFKPGTRLQCFGEVRHGPSMLEMVHPEYRLQSQGASLEETLTPFYPATEGVQQPTLRKLSDQALDYLDTYSLIDWIPQQLLRDFDLPDLVSALRIVHRPSPGSDVNALMSGLHPAHRRLAMEELIAHRLGLRLLRVQAQQHIAPTIPADADLTGKLQASLSFKLTDAQQRVLNDVLTDMELGEPMLRLIQGDVGSGKTIVAALAAANVVSAGYQVAFMAPTEILAEQHLLNFSDWFEPLGIPVGWLSGKLRVAQRRSAIEAVAMGQQRIVVGTHALFQNDVEFENLGLAIIDEQHRFGVHQRMALRNKGSSESSVPHQLIMTATPIPRTLAMTAYADLDCSIIDELPPGRKPVDTVAVPAPRRGDVVAGVAKAIAEKRQVYWVCTLIEESESLQAEAAEDTIAMLTELLPDARIGLVHGRLKSRDKDAIMQQFKAQALDLLVATTVIEVYQPPLSQNARERISIMRDTNDGFVVAQKDLDLRGAGEVLGTRQTGLAEFRIAELGRDSDMLDAVGDISDQILAHSAESVAGLIRRWIGEERKDYGGV